MAKRTAFLRALAVALLLCALAPASLAEQAYMYDYRGKTVLSLPFYEVERVFSGETLGVGSFAGASDLFIRDNVAYIVDTAGARVIAVDLDALAVTEIIAGFGGETFSKPRGVYVAQNGDMYIADTQNTRVVHLDGGRALVKLIQDPKAEVIEENAVFKPRKVAADTGGRVYVVAEGVTEGIMQFSSSGDFLNYFVANQVVPKAGEMILRLFLNKEQRQKRQVFVPIEYSNLAMDRENFLYTTTVNTWANQIKRLNFLGSDILRYEGRTQTRMGDLSAEIMPYMVDVTVDAHGNFTGLDGKRCRLYQYNRQGELLCVFGGYGDREGAFRSPVAVDQYAGRYYVLDSVKASVTVYRPTDFGAVVLGADQAYFDGRYDDAKAGWTRALVRNANYDLAYKGMGNALLKEKRYTDAMRYFERAHDRNGYSEAYKAERTRWMRQNFTYVMSGAALAVLLLVATVKARRRTRASIKAYFGLD